VQGDSTAQSPVRLFVTGGTFDKEYDEVHGRLFFQDTHVLEMLRLGRCLLCFGERQKHSEEV